MKVMDISPLQRTITGILSDAWNEPSGGLEMENSLQGSPSARRIVSMRLDIELTI